MKPWFPLSWSVALVSSLLGVGQALVSRAQADFYVSVKGSDTASGTEAQPFATLERAREAVREVQRRGSLPKGGLTVWLRAGDFVRTNAFELTSQDSGTAEAPITWAAYGGEKVRLLGGRLLTGFSPTKDPAILARVDPKARGQVVQVDLRGLGIQEFGEMKSRGFSRPTSPSHAELFFAGRPMTLARWPNEGSFEKLGSFPPSAAKGDDHGGNIGDLPGGFFYQGERPRNWKERSEVWVHGYWAWDWANSYERVVELDVDQHFIRTAPPYGLYGFRPGQRFYFLNVLEELDQLGEWYLDRKSGVLYFWPPQPIDSAPVTLSLLGEPLVKLTQTAYLTLRGMALESSRGNGVEIRGGVSNRIASCVIRNLGNNGVTIEGGQGNGVVACDVIDTGDGGVTLSGGDRQTLQASGHYVENCHFQRQGRWSKCYVPAVLLSGVGQRVSHNLIHDHPHCAILFTGNDHLIEYNEIHHIALETGDVGAIYAGRDYSYRGNRILNNYIHETGGVGMGSMGVYMDDCVSGTEVVGNVFYRVHWAMFIGGGRDHRVVNNLFVDCDPAVRMDARGLDPSPVWRDMVNDYMRAQLSQVPLDLYRERYPAMKTLDRWYGPPGGTTIRGAAFQGVPAEGNAVLRNVCFGKWLEVGWRAKPDDLEVRDNFVVEDPAKAGVTAPSPPRFVIAPDSPAFGQGFRPIPIDQIGLRADRDRQQLDFLR